MVTDGTVLAFCRRCGGSIDADWVEGEDYIDEGDGNEFIHMMCFMEERLISGWDWMKQCQNDDRRNDFFNDKWMPLLDQYKEKIDPIDRPIRIDITKPSPWIEELREQLTLDGIADVEQRPKERLQS